LGQLLRVITETSAKRSIGGRLVGSEKTLPKGITHKQSHEAQQEKIFHFVENVSLDGVT